MAFFKKLFNKGSEPKSPRGFNTLTISKITRLSDDTVMVTLDIPEALKAQYNFIPGQYLDFAITIDGKEQRRSYSICSGKDEELSVAIKKVDKGIVSTWFNEVAKAEAPIFASAPQGSFTLPKDIKRVVSFAAGSGITPIVSIAKDIEPSEAKLNLFFGNRTESSILFKSDLDGLKNTSVSYFLSGESKDGFENGRLDNDNISSIIKGNLDLLKSDYFLLCGPEEMIVSAIDTLKVFGVAEDKIKYELFTAPVKMQVKASDTSGSFSGISQVSIILDDETDSFELKSDGMSILEKSNREGLDAPYSCKGGVCSTCKAKVIKGKASMKMNYSLTDKEVEEGFILTCQAHPDSEEVVISFDDV
ncbi:MAG: 2Fe-2S iron-sulfur cluster-binding protein [Crocinitomicaceae bacterium]|nr:2Fe-2S iron-sulfur cluster-binding protein [Crocinitomicaceae bacterium]